MADDTAPESQVPEGTTPTESQTPEEATTQPSDASETPAEEPFDQDRALSTIRNLRKFEKEAKDAKRRLADYEKAEQTRKDAELSEVDRLRKTVEQREAELKFEQQSARDRTNHYEVQLQAGRAGIVDPDAAVKLLDWSALDYDDEGKPTNVAEALEQLVRDKPYLAAPQQAQQGQQRQPTNPTNPATRTSPAGTRRYTAAEIQDRAFWNENKKDIMLALRQDRVDP